MFTGTIRTTATLVDTCHTLLEVAQELLVVRRTRSRLELMAAVEMLRGAASNAHLAVLANLPRVTDAVLYDELSVGLDVARRDPRARQPAHRRDAQRHRPRRRAARPAPALAGRHGQLTGRLSYGVDSTIVVRVDTFAAARTRASRSSRSAGVATRTLRM